MAAFEAKDRQSPLAKGCVVFVGSSSIRFWKLEKSFPKLDAINRGFGGSQLADSVRHAERLILKHEPRMVVLYAGDNDLAGGKTPEQVAADFEAFVRVVGGRLPKARIVFLAIKPSPSRMKFFEQQKTANRLIEAICKGHSQTQFVDVFTPMLDADGKPRAELFLADRLHMNEKGYELWAKILKPVLEVNPTPGKVRVAGIVLKWVREDKEANYRRAEPLIREAARNGAKIICTTECFLDGYAIADKTIPLDRYRGLGEPIPDGPYCKRLAMLAGELKVHLIAGMLEADGTLRYNTAVMFGPEANMIGKYRKQKLGHELVRNTPGQASPIFDTPFGRVGLMICADRTDANIVRRLKDAGAELLICPSGGMFGPKSNDPIVQARSRENALPIVFVHPVEFLVTGKDGEILANVLRGRDLFLKPDQVGTESDFNEVRYFDLPNVSNGEVARKAG